MELLTAVVNPYWDAVKNNVDPTGSLWNTPSVDGLGRYRDRLGSFDAERWARECIHRRDFVGRYSWTIPDPDTLAFVAEHAAGGLVDPMAGTGYWAYLLGQLGVEVINYDLEPGTNHWHKDQPLHASIDRMDCAEAAAKHPDRTLFLSWPPYGSPAGAEAVRAYGGSRVIYVGEDEYGCCGDEDLFALFASDWTRIAERVPVQWDGMHDQVIVFDRVARTGRHRAAEVHVRSAEEQAAYIREIRREAK